MALITLSILIPTTKSREKVFSILKKEIERQIEGLPVELLINEHETDNVGKKRNDLLRQAKGTWVVSIDSDDHISKDYVNKILKATETNPDCIGISGYITTNGKNKKQWHISKKYGTWYQLGGVYYRTPNHISPVKREIALKAMFPEISFGEDAGYSERILPLLKTEVVVKGDIYHYDFKNK